MLLVIIIDRLW